MLNTDPKIEKPAPLDDVPACTYCGKLKVPRRTRAGFTCECPGGKHEEAVKQAFKQHKYYFGDA